MKLKNELHMALKPEHAPEPDRSAAKRYHVWSRDHGDARPMVETDTDFDANEAQLFVWSLLRCGMEVRIEEVEP
jgi:hypothetical protein